MSDQIPHWMSEELAVLQRMRLFHEQRAPAATEMLVQSSELDNGFFVIHLMPEDSVRKRVQFTGSELKSHSGNIKPFGGYSGDARFNVDGLVRFAGYDAWRAYSQLYRDGRLEAAVSGICYRQGNNLVMRVQQCEQALHEIVPAYLEFCSSIGIQSPVWLFAALVDCQGARIKLNSQWHDYTRNAIDRSPAFLPELEVTSQDAIRLLRPICDALWQSAGAEMSLNYDADGNWKPR